MKTAVETIERIQKILQLPFPQVSADGDIGKITRGACKALGAMPDDEKIGPVPARAMRVQIQMELRERFPQVKADGVFGPITFSALSVLDEMGDHESVAEEVEAGTLPAEPVSDWQRVKASSFADPADIAGFRRCKAAGGSDVQCFAKGDNGVGYWGADTTADVPLVALPREDWRHAGKKGGAPVEIRFPGVANFVAALGDTMPARANIRNGAGMDCNPCTVRKLGQRLPMMLGGVEWRWA